MAAEGSIQVSGATRADDREKCRDESPHRGRILAFISLAIISQTRDADGTWLKPEELDGAKQRGGL